MNRQTDNDDLLAGVLSEAAPADFREALLGETLHRVRRRRRWRQMRRAGGVFAIAGLLAVLVWPNQPKQAVISEHSKPLVKNPEPASYRLVRTRPLPDGDVVTTRSFSDGQFVATIATVVQVVTVPGEFRQINDDELLALVSGRPAVLIRTGPHSEELVFANSEDQKDFLKN